MKKSFELYLSKFSFMLINTERILSDTFEANEDKIPCEYCEELINFDQYITHTVSYSSK
jgi:hypothetical protein